MTDQHQLPLQQSWPVVALLGASAAFLALAPLALADSYAWFEHTTSESAAQGVEGAWVGRTGFLLLGFAVFLVARRAARRWGPLAVLMHQVFAVCMLAVGVYSIRSWVPDTPYDQIEDLLHSVGATVMGFGFAFGVTAVAWRRHAAGMPWRVLDAVAVAASVVLPIGMSLYGSVDGILQRVMFAIAYLWYAREAVLGQGPAVPGVEADSRIPEVEQVQH